MRVQTKFNENKKCVLLKKNDKKPFKIIGKIRLIFPNKDITVKPNQKRENEMPNKDSYKKRRLYPKEESMIIIKSEYIECMMKILEGKLDKILYRKYGNVQRYRTF